MFLARLIHGFLMNQTNESNVKVSRRVLFERPYEEGIKQVRIQSAVGAGNKGPKLLQVIVGLFLHTPFFMNVELIITHTNKGVSIGIPKWCSWGTCQLQRVYKKPSGSIQIEFEFLRKLVIRRERQLRPDECLLEYKPK